MNVAENIILGALLRGGCIRTYYRIAAWQAEQPLMRIPELYVLEIPGEPGDILLSETDFQGMARQLIETDTWEEISSGICYGGGTWLLRAEMAT